MNDFSGGLKTEFHGLNFPPNAVTSEQNCRFTLTKEVIRRGGIDIETNNAYQAASTATSINTYKWNNVGGDGQTQIIVTQVGGTLYFYLSSAATSTSPISANILSGQTVSLSTFLVAGSSNDPTTVECNFADGNGYLFVYNQYCEPFYVTYNSSGNTITATQINITVRDFDGIYEPGVASSFRPTTLTAEHQYNLQNQGWTSAASWSATDSGYHSLSSTLVLTVAAGITGISGGQTFAGSYNVLGVGNGYYMAGTVTSYVGTTLTLNVTSYGFGGGTYTGNSFYVYSVNTNLISTWYTAITQYPSNSDVWWVYKNPQGIFSNSPPVGQNSLSTTISNSVVSKSQAPKGAYTFPAFNINRSAVSGIGSLTTVSTLARPSVGTWFQGRVWYSGVNANFQPTGDAIYKTWTENIYFSQIVNNANDFGSCFQTNDPTSENLFDLLPTDGGVITIQGSGSIYELFPIQNGLIVRAANGIWFITGSQGIGFSATDYTVTKISGVESVSQRPSVNVQGYPVFWNQEGIWTVMPSAQGGGLVVENVALDTILTFYSNIPLASKQYVRGDYNPITYEIQWLYRSTVEGGISNRYQFDTILCLNTHTKAFYHFVVTTGGGAMNLVGINFVQGPGGTNTPVPAFKYYCYGAGAYTFAQEFPSVYYDWTSTGTPVSYTSSFTTAYYLHGGGIKKFQPNYLYMYSRNAATASYVVQGTWDFAVSGNSGRVSVRQQVNNNISTTYQIAGYGTKTVNFFTPTNYGMMYRRHKLRGRGTTMQIQVTSIAGQPFDFMGWAIWEVMGANP
jgi:hypothetical protein